MGAQPGALCRAQHHGLRILIARQRRAPALCNLAAELRRQQTKLGIDPRCQRRIAGDRAQRQYRVRIGGDLVDLSLLQLAEQKVSTGFIGDQIITLLIEQGVERLQITSQRMPAVACCQRGRQLRQRAAGNRQLSIVAVKHHRALILTIAVNTQRRAEPAGAERGAGRQRRAFSGQDQVNLAALQRLQLRCPVRVALQLKPHAALLAEGAEIVSINPPQAIADAH